MKDVFTDSKDFQQEISRIILNKSNNLEKILEEYHLYDIARVVLSLNKEDLTNFFSNVSSDFAAEIFEYLDGDEVYEIFPYLTEQETIKIIENMEADEAVDLLKFFNEREIRLLNKINPAKRRELRKLMAYKESQIGAFMTDSFLTLDSTLTVRQAMIQVTKEAHEADYISIIYIVKNDKLVGYLRLKNLIVARANEMIKDIMETRFVKVHPEDDKEDVANIMQETNESSIPIINNLGRIIGIITYDDLMDIIDLIEEEDYTKFAAVSDKEIDIDSSNLKNSIRARLPWLIILLGFSTITSIVLSLFEQRFTGSNGAIYLASQLAVYLPLISGMSGNTGTQSLAVMIRYLTKNENVNKKHIQVHLLREFKTGVLQGLIIGVIIFLMIIFTTFLRLNSLNHQNLIYAIVTSGSIIVALTISTSLGAIIPVAMNSVKIDPAVASGPFITTVSDIITLSIYYSVSLAILLPLYI